MRKGKIITLAALAAVVALGACNTVEGVGKDVKSAGSAVEKAGQ